MVSHGEQILNRASNWASLDTNKELLAFFYFSFDNLDFIKTAFFIVDSSYY